MGLFYDIVESVLGNGSDDQAVRFVFETSLDLTALNLEPIVTAGLVNRKADTEPAGLVDEPVIDPKPIGIFEMGDKYPDAPFFLCLVQWG